jgi:hypothetical protein
MSNVLVTDGISLAYIACSEECVRRVLKEVGDSDEDLHHYLFTVEQTNKEEWKELLRSQQHHCGLELFKCNNTLEEIN